MKPKEKDKLEKRAKDTNGHFAVEGETSGQSAPEDILHFIVDRTGQTGELERGQWWEGWEPRTCAHCWWGRYLGQPSALGKKVRVFL